MAMTAQQKIIAKNIRDFDEDLARRKKTLKWKFNRAWFLIRKKVGLI